MYARLTTVNLGPGMRQQGEELATKMNAQIRTRKGLKSAVFFGDEATGEYGGLVLWETKEDGEAAFQVIFPQLQQMLSGIAKGQPKTGLYEVYEPGN